MIKIFANRRWKLTSGLSCVGYYEKDKKVICPERIWLRLNTAYTKTDLQEMIKIFDFIEKESQQLNGGKK